MTYGASVAMRVAMTEAHDKLASELTLGRRGEQADYMLINAFHGTQPEESFGAQHRHGQRRSLGHTCSWDYTNEQLQHGFNVSACVRFLPCFNCCPLVLKRQCK